jgi:uncharacterized protein YyaL (SSP411 family)
LQFTHDILRDRLLARAGLLERRKKFITLEEIVKELHATTWDTQFLEYMFNRLIMGRLRYGPKKANAPKYDYAGSIEGKIKLYKETGNTEYLVDIANYAMLEFRHGAHPSKHFSSTDDADHCRRIDD